MEPKVITCCSEKYVLPLNEHFSGIHHFFLLNFCEAAGIWGNRLNIYIYIYICLFRKFEILRTLFSYGIVFQCSMMCIISTLGLVLLSD